MKPTSKCPYYSEDEKCESCDNSCKHFSKDFYPDHVAFYCDIEAANDEDYCSKSDYLSDQAYEDHRDRMLGF